ARMPEGRLKDVSSVAEVLALFPNVAQDRSSLSSKPTQLVEGLLAARFAGRRLVVDESAVDLPSEAIRGAKGVVVLESAGEVHDIVAINYAAAFELDVVLIPSVERETVRALPEVLAKWSKNNSYFEFKEFERKL